MPEDLLLLVVPRIHRVPVERLVTAQPGRRLDRLGVAPHGVLGGALPDLHAPVRGLAFEGAVRVVRGGPQQRRRDVLAGHVQHRQQPGLVQQPPAGGVEHDLTAQQRPHPARELVEVQQVLRTVDPEVRLRPAGP